MSDTRKDEDHLPASEAGTGMMPEDDSAGGDVHRPASEDHEALEADKGGARQSWPGRGFGSIPPPG